MTDRELIQQALEALEWVNTSPWLEDCYHVFDKRVAALRERLAQPEQEPVAWSWEHDGRVVNAFPFKPNSESEYWRAKGWTTRPLVYGDTAPQRLEEQEPSAWEDVLGAIARGWTHDDNKHKTMDVQLAVAIAKEIQDMVAAPPQRREWVGLTDDDLMELPGFDYDEAQFIAEQKFARAIEAKLREKNT